MKSNKLLKIGLPIVGVATLATTTSVLITSCSNNDESPSVSVGRLSQMINLFYQGFLNNQLSFPTLAQNFNPTATPNGNQNDGTVSKIKKIVEDFNKKNQEVLEKAKIDCQNFGLCFSSDNTKKSLNFFFGDTTKNNFDEKYQLQINNKNVFSWFIVNLVEENGYFELDKSPVANNN